MTNILNIAEPTIVPDPSEDAPPSTQLASSIGRRANIAVNNSGAELPTAMSVAPATSEFIPNLLAIFSRAGTNTPSQIFANPQKVASRIII